MQDALSYRVVLSFLSWKLVVEPLGEQLDGSQVVRQDTDGKVLSDPSREGGQ